MVTALQTEKDTISVVIIEDFKLTRVGLRCALNSNKDINVVAESENATEGLSLIERHKPDVVLMDLGLAGMNGIEATIKVREMNPDIKVIALTSHDREEEVISALSAGAMAYCLKDIDPAKSVYEVVSQGNETIRMGGKDVNVRAYLSRFNFSGADQEKKCAVLSGGERNRLHLAIALKQEGNVLLLDEPTNDIDVNTLRALEEGLEAFAGCAVIISHDRWFLDRICTHILAFEGEGNVFYFEGNYSEYESNKAQRLGLEEPKRARYRKLMDE
jgi:ATPase subunit of ABC transporter with duplicated ATPase domains